MLDLLATIIGNILRFVDLVFSFRFLLRQPVVHTHPTRNSRSSSGTEADPIHLFQHARQTH